MALTCSQRPSSPCFVRPIVVGSGWNFHFDESPVEGLSLWALQSVAEIKFLWFCHTPCTTNPRATSYEVRSGEQRCRCLETVIVSWKACCPVRLATVWACMRAAWWDVKSAFLQGDPYMDGSSSVENIRGAGDEPRLPGWIVPFGAGKILHGFCLLAALVKSSVSSSRSDVPACGWLATSKRLSCLAVFVLCLVDYWQVRVLRENSRPACRCSCFSERGRLYRANLKPVIIPAGWAKTTEGNPWYSSMAGGWNWGLIKAFACQRFKEKANGGHADESQPVGQALQEWPLLLFEVQALWFVPSRGDGHHRSAGLRRVVVRKAILQYFALLVMLIYGAKLLGAEEALDVGLYCCGILAAFQGPQRKQQRSSRLQPGSLGLCLQPYSEWE